MRIYFSGIGGVGIGPLAEIAADAGYDVVGSDLKASPQTQQLEARGVHVYLGQTGEEIAQAHREKPIDWFVHTAALPPTHPELVFCTTNHIKTSKRDELLASIIKDKSLKLIAVSGTHGKTTTTGMLVWAMKSLGIPVSYSVGSSLSFGPSGAYDAASRYFVYECDEFDKNMLHFWPHLALITSLDHDHFDTYPTVASYREAFCQFITQSDMTLLWEREVRYLGQPDLAANYEAYDELRDLSHIALHGDHNRHNAYLVERACYELFPERSHAEIIQAINSFPGTGRRFEKLADNLYSDYAHHPAEITATLQMAREVSDRVIAVYQPHQNIRQHEVRAQYTSCFDHAEHVYWLPTYLSREDPALPILQPADLTSALTHPDAVSYAELNDELWEAIQAKRTAGYTVVALGAGDIDTWLRGKLTENA